MSRILIISAVFPPEPVVSSRISADLAEELSKNNFVTVLRPKPTRPYGFVYREMNCEFVNYKVIELSSYTCPKLSLFGRFRESLSMGLYCSKYIKQNKRSIDLIYNGAWAVVGQYLVTKVAKKYNIPVIIPVQDIYPESLLAKIPNYRWLNKLVFLCLKTVDKYILDNSIKIYTISDKMKKYLAQTRSINENKFQVVHNWQDEAQFLNFKEKGIKKQDKDNFTYMYLGNIGPLAGLDFVIDAFAHAHLINSRLIIAGSGSMKEILQKKTIESNYTNIEFWTVPEGKVPEIQDQADVMLLPIKKGATESSIPSKLPAYMFSKKPIIASVDNDSDSANTIISANCGWVIAPENRDDLVLIMKKVATLPKEELRLRGEKGFDFAIKHFSRKNNLKKLVSMFNEIITT